MSDTKPMQLTILMNLNCFSHSNFWAFLYPTFSWQFSLK